MADLRIHTHIHSRYPVFDASGRLPFSIVFGLCRRSPVDQDPRPLCVDAAGSVLDVTYALAHGLLTLHQQDQDDSHHWKEVNLEQLKDIPARTSDFISLSSPVGRREPGRAHFLSYRCQIDANGKFASLLDHGKTYKISMASDDLGVKWCAHGERADLLDDSGRPIGDSEPSKLVNSKPTAGNATFTVMENLTWPPRVETRLRLRTFAELSTLARRIDDPRSDVILEITATNTGPHPVTVKTRGSQRILIPWGPFEPEGQIDDDRVRVIHTMQDLTHPPGLQIVNYETGEVVRGKSSHSTALTTTRPGGHRPIKAEDVTILTPGVPVVRNLDVRKLISNLKDGKYKIQMQSKGCRWWQGAVNLEDGEIPAHLSDNKSHLIPPLMLESQDEVEVHVKNGSVT